MMSDAPNLVRVTETRRCCSTPWEEAYARFETPEEEIAKFMNRLLKLGAANWNKDLRVVELFCGRGNGLRALQRLGFQNLEGADLSESLLAEYKGPAKCYLCDCRQLPFEDDSRDLIIVQGGLHHLPLIPEDLEVTLREVRRVLRPSGFSVIIEPWLTPFLRLVHCACASRLTRHCWKKLDALATMIENERATYEQWLGKSKVIHALFLDAFNQPRIEVGWGKITCLGYVRKK